MKHAGHFPLDLRSSHRLLAVVKFFSLALGLLLVSQIAASGTPDPCCVWIPGASLSAGPGGGSVSMNISVLISGTNCPVSSGSAVVGPGAATGDFSIMASSNICAWTAGSDVTWIHITAGSSGTGTGTVSFAVDANSNCTSRAGTLTIAGQIFPVTQVALALATDSAASAAGGGTNTVVVTAVTNCSWTAASNDSWLQILSGNSGTGNGTVSYVAEANASCNARTGTLLIAGHTYTVNQAVAPANFVVLPTSLP